MAYSKIKVAIFGGSGYGGSELLRLLLPHPFADVVLVTANEHAGKRIDDVHKNLRGFTDLLFASTPDEAAMKELDTDAAFFALPHGQAMKLVPHLTDAVKVIDLSGDFRLNDKEEFARYYGFEHTAEQLKPKFVYGLTETNRDAIKTASHIANPGCFATAVQLALAPLILGRQISGKVIVDAKTGSSGSGAKPAANTHHPQRVNSFYAYKPFTHQHLPEIKQGLGLTDPGNIDIVMMTHSMPVSRGIFASCYAALNGETDQETLSEAFREFYRESPFVRIVSGSPDINWVKMTNFCDISISVSGTNVAIFSAIDNLVKGAAGQAIQNMNLMFGLDETCGLLFAGTNP